MSTGPSDRRVPEAPWATQELKDIILEAWRPDWTKPDHPKYLADPKPELAEKIAIMLRDWEKPQLDQALAALEDAGYEIVKRGGSTPPTCQGGCNCSCCYGHPDKTCHCYQDTCSECKGDRIAHGQKPIEGGSIHCHGCGEQVPNAIAYQDDSYPPFHFNEEGGGHTTRPDAYDYPIYPDSTHKNPWTGGDLRP